jgi:hypothetical protein
MPSNLALMVSTAFAVSYAVLVYRTASWLTRPHFGVERLLTAGAVVMLATLVLLPVVGVAVSLTSSVGEQRREGLFFFAALVSVNVAVLWRPGRMWWRGRAARRVVVARALDWCDYGAVVAVLLSLYYRLAHVAVGLAPEGSTDATHRFYYRLTLGVLLFLIAQVTTSWAIRSLGTSLRQDWTRSDGRPFSRSQQYLLVAGPVLACVVPSVFVGALLAGVLVHLVLLGLAWACTDLPPCTPRRASAGVLAWALRSGGSLSGRCVRASVRSLSSVTGPVR